MERGYMDMYLVIGLFAVLTALAVPFFIYYGYRTQQIYPFFIATGLSLPILIAATGYPKKK